MRPDLATFLDDFRRHGDAAAIVAYRGNRRLVATWAELASLADRFAAELVRRGVPMGERVVLWGQNGLEWMGAFFGCIERGVIAVPLDPAGASDFARRVIADTKPRLVVGDQELLRELGDQVPSLAPNQVPGQIPGQLPHMAFQDLQAQLPQPPFTGLREPRLGPDTPFQILFTSGTTAEPKGVVHTHRNVLASLAPIEREMQKYLKYERPFHPIRFLHTLPLSHVFGQFMGLWIPPLMAAEVHFENRLQAQRLIETIHRERISVVCSVPRVLDLLRSHLLAAYPELVAEIEQDQGEKIWKRWWHFRRIHRLFGYKFWAFVCGGASLSPELEGFWTTLGFALVQGYGMTETSALISLNHPFKPGKGTMGKVLPGRDVRITDEGEILVRGEMVSRATWQQGALRQNESEWLATGDLAQRDEQGQLHFAGRRNQVIVTPAGLNIHPEDVEAALNVQRGVQASAVVPQLTPAGTEPVAVLLFRGPREEAQRAVVAANQQLAEYQQVRQWRLWPELDLPRTSTGKIRRPPVTEWVNAQRDRVAGPASDPLLALILSISHATAADAGGDARLSEDLGLDSLGRVQLQSELEQRLGLMLEDETLERVVTLGDLRRALGMADDAGAVGLEMAAAEGGREVSDARSGMRIGTSAGAPSVAAKSSQSRQQDIYPRWPWWWPVRLARNAFIQLVSQPLVWFLAAPRVERPLHGQPQRPVLLIANHVTTYDVPLIWYGLPGSIRRRVAAAMAGDMLRDWRRMRNLAPGLNWLGPLTWLLVTGLFNAFPLPRSAGFRQSFQHAGEALDRGYNVLVFPEGHRAETGLQPFRPGIGLLVRDSGTPVIPVALKGLSELKQRRRRWFRSGALTVRVGEPLEFGPAESPEKITERLYETLQAMLGEY